MEQMQAWYGSPLGERVAAAEERALADAVSDLHQGSLVRVGPGRQPLPVSPGLRQWQVGAGGADATARLEQLPLRRESVEVLILSHALELASEPLECLAEACQAVRADGRLLILTFNPLGLWGTARLWGRMRSAASPWRGAQWPASSIGVHLRRHGFVAWRVRYLVFRPPLERPRFQNRVDSWEDVLRRMGRLSAGVQLVVAHRRELVPTQGLRSGAQDPAYPVSGAVGAACAGSACGVPAQGGA